jgi:tetratricopeptide (TPR) repeat protein
MSDAREWLPGLAVILLFIGDGLLFPWVRGGLLLLLLVAMIDQISAEKNQHWRTPGMAALGGWLALALWQLLPLPPGVLKVLAPGTWRLYQDTAWVLTPGVWMPLGPIPDRTLQGVFQVCLLAALYWLLACHGSDREKLIRLLRRLCWGGAVYALGLTIWWTGLKKVAGQVPQWSDRFHALLPVVVLLPLATVLYLYSRPRRSYGSRGERLRTLFRQPEMHGHVFLLAIVVVLGLLSLLGAPVPMQIALVMGLLMTAACLLARSASRRGWLLPVLMALVLAIGVGLKKQHTLSLNVETSSYQASLRVDRLSLGRDFLFFGAGPGNLDDLERRYGLPTEKPHQQDVVKPWDVLLNGWGLGGAILLLWWWLAVCSAAVRGWLKRRNRFSLFLFAGALGGLVIDFTVRGMMSESGGFVPATPSVFLAGILVATGCFHSSGEADLSLRTLPASGSRMLLPALVGFLAVGTLFYTGKTWVGASVRQAGDAAAQEVSRALSDDRRAWSQRALWLDPLEGRYPFALGEDLQARQEPERALPYLIRGVRLNPLDGPSIYRLGGFLDSLDRPKAGMQLMAAGLRHAPLAADLHRDYVLRLLAGKGGDSLFAPLRQLLILTPEQTGFWLRYLEDVHFDQAWWETLLPRQSGVYRQYGDYCLARREKQAASRAFRKAVHLAATEQVVDPGLFLHVAQYVAGQGQLEEALEVIRFGMRSRPRDISLLLTAATLYERLGITYRATELYRKVLLLDPENQEVGKRLERLGEP